MNANSQEQTGSFPDLRHDEATIVSPGALLRDRRLALRLNEWDIAREMRLQTQYILDLEADNFDAFSSLAFVRGYLRGYAKIVGIAEVDVIQLFNQLSLQDKVTAGVPKYITHDKGQSDRYWRWMGLIVIAFVVVSLVLWWQNRSTNMTILNTSVNNTLSKVATLEHNLRVEAEMQQQAAEEAKAASAAISTTAQAEQALGASGSLLQGMTDSATTTTTDAAMTANTAIATETTNSMEPTNKPKSHPLSTSQSSVHAAQIDGQAPRF